MQLHRGFPHQHEAIITARTIRFARYLRPSSSRSSIAISRIRRRRRRGRPEHHDHGELESSMAYDSPFQLISSCFLRNAVRSRSPAGSFISWPVSYQMSRLGSLAASKNACASDSERPYLVRGLKEQRGWRFMPDIENRVQRCKRGDELRQGIAELRPNSNRIRMRTGADVIGEALQSAFEDCRPEAAVHRDRIGAQHRAAAMPTNAIRLRSTSCDAIEQIEAARRTSITARISSLIKSRSHRRRVRCRSCRAPVKSRPVSRKSIAYDAQSLSPEPSQTTAGRGPRFFASAKMAEHGARLARSRTRSIEPLRRHVTGAQNFKVERRAGVIVKEPWRVRHTAADPFRIEEQSTANAGLNSGKHCQRASAIG